MNYSEQRQVKNRKVIVPKEEKQLEIYELGPDYRMNCMVPTDVSFPTWGTQNYSLPLPPLSFNVIYF